MTDEELGFKACYDDLVQCRREVKRLRGEAESWTETVEEWKELHANRVAEVANACADNKRLREALDPFVVEHNCSSARYCYICQASRALEGEK